MGIISRMPGKVPTTINGNEIATVADLQGADATGELLTAFLDNQAVDSTVAVDELVYA